MLNATGELDRVNVNVSSHNFSSLCVDFHTGKSVCIGGERCKVNLRELRRMQKLRLRFEFVNISQTWNGNNVRYYFSYDAIPMIVYY